MKRKDKPSKRKNAKRMNLVQLDGWGEHPVIEPSDGIRQWLLIPARRNNRIIPGLK